MSFFIRDNKKENRKRKIDKKNKKNEIPKHAKLNKKVNFKAADDITSESEIESVIDEDVPISPDISDGETADAKRNRLAKQILEDIKDKYGHEDEEISNYLKNEILERTGRAFHEVAQEYMEPQLEDVIQCKWSKLSVVTCTAIHPNNQFFYSGGKDGAILKWCLITGKKLGIINGFWKTNSGDGHIDEILALAITSDAKFLASAGRDLVIRVWDPSDLKILGTLKGHKKAITGLSFRTGSHQLFSSSEDKSIKLWAIGEMAYIETLFGHEDGALAVDSLSQERVLSCGGRDGTVRLWKIIDESHLIYHGHSGCIECVKFIDDRHFYSASDDNSLAIWTIDRKKPIVTIKNAHSDPPRRTLNTNGFHHLNTTNCSKEPINHISNNKAENESTNKTDIGKCDEVANDVNDDDDDDIEKKVNTNCENWISSIAALRHSNLLASGSRDGLVKFWEVGAGFRSLKFLFSISIDGFINSLEFSNDGAFLLVGVGREHRLGRWFKTHKNVKNSICVVPLHKKNDHTT